MGLTRILFQYDFEICLQGYKREKKIKQHIIIYKNDLKQLNILSYNNLIENH